MGGSRGVGAVRRVLGRVWRVVRVLVADRDAGRRPPGGNCIPNSDGDGGQVISSGHPGGR